MNTNLLPLYTAVQSIQRTLKCPKGQFNPHGQFNYRKCEDILEAAKEPLIQNQCMLTLSDEIVNIGPRFYICATARIIHVPTGEYMTATGYAREDETRKGMDVAQVTGASSSYARKYALCGLFCLDDERDPDTMDNSGSNQQRPQRTPRSAQQAFQQAPVQTPVQQLAQGTVILRAYDPQKNFSAAVDYCRGKGWKDAAPLRNIYAMTDEHVARINEALNK